MLINDRSTGRGDIQWNINRINAVDEEGFILQFMVGVQRFLQEACADIIMKHENAISVDH